MSNTLTLIHSQYLIRPGFRLSPASGSAYECRHNSLAVFIIHDIWHVEKLLIGRHFLEPIRFSRNQNVFKKFVENIRPGNEPDTWRQKKHA